MRLLQHSGKARVATAPVQRNVVSHKRPATNINKDCQSFPEEFPSPLARDIPSDTAEFRMLCEIPHRFRHTSIAEITIQEICSQCPLPAVYQERFTTWLLFRFHTRKRILLAMHSCVHRLMHGNAYLTNCKSIHLFMRGSLYPVEGRQRSGIRMMSARGT